MCAYLDRINVSFAKLQMMQDLKLSDAVYGLGAGGVFFVGYLLFEVPSNLILLKVEQSGSRPSRTSADGERGRRSDADVRPLELRVVGHLPVMRH